MNQELFRAIRARASRWSFKGTYLPDAANPTPESSAQLNQDRLVLLEHIYDLEGRLKRAASRQEELHEFAAQSITVGAGLQGELETALRLLTATASILPYRKNKNAEVVQGSVLTFLRKHGCSTVLENAIETQRKERENKKFAKALDNPVDPV